METGERNNVVLDVGYSEIKAALGHIKLGKGTGRSLFDVQTVSEKIRGLSKRGIHNKEEFSLSIKRALDALSDTTNVAMHEVQVVFSSPKNKFIKRTRKIRPKNNSDGIVVNAEWIQGLANTTTEKLQNSFRHHTCSDIRPVSIVADGEEIVHDYEDYVALSSVEITFACILTPTTFFETLRETAERHSDVRKMVPTWEAVEQIVTEEQKENGIIVCDIGSKFTDVFMYTNGMIHDIMSLEFGGENITKALALSRKVAIEEAEMEKKKVAQGKIVDAFSSKEQREIRKEILAFAKTQLSQKIKEAGGKKNFASGILLLGAGSLYPSIPEVLKKETGLYTFHLPKNKLIQSQVQTHPVSFEIAFYSLQAMTQLAHGFIGMRSVTNPSIFAFFARATAAIRNIFQ